MSLLRPTGQVEDEDEDEDESMLFRSTPTRWGEPAREMEVPITREQLADWLIGIDLKVAAPQLTDSQREFLLQGAMLADDDLLGVTGPMRA